MVNIIIFPNMYRETFLKPITETLSLGSYQCNVNEVVGKVAHNRREREGV